MNLGWYKRPASPKLGIDRTYDPVYFVANG